MQKPSLGRIVLALIEPTMNNGSDVAPAVITRVWDEHPDGGHVVNVRVLADAPTMPLSFTSVRLVADEATARAADHPAVFWPPRV